MNEKDLREMDLEWKRDRLSKQISGDSGEPEAEESEAAPLSRRELKHMLKRERAPKGEK